MRRTHSQYGPPRKYGILIQCEGLKTEPRYLADFCRDCGATRRFNVQVKPGRGQNAVVTVRAAIAESKRTSLGVNVYDEVWCVLDVEHAAHAATLTEALALAKQHNITVCLSNPSFEVWLLAHFERVKRDFPDSDAVERRLSETYWKKHFGDDYDKADPRLYERLQSRRAIAVENAAYTLEDFNKGKTCREANASTEVYKLVRKLLPSPSA